MRSARMTGPAGWGIRLRRADCMVGRRGRGKVVELLGSAGHQHYRVRWDNQRESIVYPSDGVVVTARATGRGALAEESD